MTGEEFLNRGFSLKAKLNNLYEALEYWQAKATKASVAYSETGVQKTNRIKTNEEFIFKIIECEESLKKQIEKLYTIKLEIQNVILNVEDTTEQSILFKRYIKELSWNEIAKSENYTKRNIFNIHNKAIISVEKILKGGNKCHIEKQ